MGKFTEPELLVNDHHGSFMMQLLVKENQSLETDLFTQIQKSITQEDLESILKGPEDEFHFEACDNLTRKTFKTKTGQKFSIEYAEGGIWAIPFCFRGKKRDEFFGY